MSDLIRQKELIPEWCPLGDVFFCSHFDHHAQTWNFSLVDPLHSYTQPFHHFQINSRHKVELMAGQKHAVLSYKGKVCVVQETREKTFNLGLPLHQLIQNDDSERRMPQEPDKTTNDTDLVIECSIHEIQELLKQIEAHKDISNLTKSKEVQSLMQILSDEGSWEPPSIRAESKVETGTTQSERGPLSASRLRHAHWKTAVIQMPQKTAKAALLMLFPHPTETLGCSLPLLYRLFQALHIPFPSQVPCACCHPEYHSEQIRLKSFHNWPHQRNLQVIELARAGFFFTLQPQGDPNNASPNADGVTCFYCNLSLDGWDTDDDPWIAHATASPFCHLIKGAPTCNIAASTAQFATLTESPTTTTRILSVNPHYCVLMTDTHISIWDYTFELKKLTEVKFDSPLQSIDMPITIINHKSDKSQEQWNDWATPDLEVTIASGVYSGATGKIMRIENSNPPVVVYIFGLQEEIQFFLSELKPGKPKVNGKVKFIKGSHKGDEALFLGNQKNMAQVKLTTEEIILVDPVQIAPFFMESQSILPTCSLVMGGAQLLAGPIPQIHQNIKIENPFPQYTSPFLFSTPQDSTIYVLFQHTELKKNFLVSYDFISPREPTLSKQIEL